MSPGRSREGAEDPERLLLKRQPDAALPQLSRAQVELKGAEPVERAGELFVRMRLRLNPILD
jgi:hypothetical protein